jgi:nitrogen fixation protein FixH
MKTKFNPWPLGVVVVFIIFISIMATAVTIAVTHRDGLVEQNYYDSELRYQDAINNTARAEKSGAVITQDLNAGTLTIQIPAAQLAQNLSGKIELYRPSAAGLDRIFALSPDAGGKQVVDISKLARGAWQIHVHWNAGGAEYFLEQKIAITAK